jgi:Gas vesicle synthesis protein GvpO
VAESKSKSRSRKGSSGSGKSSSGSGKSSSGSGKSSSGSGKSSSRSSSSRGRDRSPREVAFAAARQMQELIGRPIEAVTGIEKNGREWTVTVEVLELERVPNTTDMLGKYELTVDKNGELTGAQRTRRYNRAEAGED